MQEWTIVIPVRGSASVSKSRFGPGDNSEITLAMALDTVEAALAVAPVVVVTTGGAEFEALGARVIQERGEGLVPVLGNALAMVGEGSTGILLGDHPALQPGELRAALDAAAEHPLAMVADSEGTGTALITARRNADHRPAFGADSRVKHLAHGYVELTGDWPGLARDIDLPDHLESLDVGPRTRAYLARR